MEREIRHLIDTPLGWFQLSGNANAITKSRWVEEDEAVVGGKLFFPDWVKSAEEQIKDYFLGIRTKFDLPIQHSGDDFEKRLWQMIELIEFGTTIVHSDMIFKHGPPMLSSQFENILFYNPLLLLVPCHRVVHKEKSVLAFGGGQARKEWLLKHEMNHKNDPSASFK